VKIIKTNHLTPEYFINSTLGHTTVLSTFFSLAFCVCVQVNGSSQWRDLKIEPTAVDKTMDHLFVLNKLLI